MDNAKTDGSGHPPLSHIGLFGHTSPETAYVVDDYPYGFRLRCKIRYWIERTKNGERFCSQTTNPKRSGEVWNKPKKSTYCAVAVLYYESDTGHVKWDGISFYERGERIKAFVDSYGSGLDDWQQGMCKVLLARRAIEHERYKHVTVENNTRKQAEASGMGDLVQTDEQGNDYISLSDMAQRIQERRGGE